MGYPRPIDYEPILDAEAWQATRYVNPETAVAACVQLEFVLDNIEQ
jgi:hypothetical protein